jgi:hypothetical protein
LWARHVSRKLRRMGIGAPESNPLTEGFLP